MTKEQADSVWREACQQLKELLHPDIFSRWIEIIELGDVTDDTVHLKVDNDFYQTWLEDNYLGLITQAFEAASGEPVNLKFQVDTNPAPIAEPDTSNASKKPTIRDRITARFNKEMPALNPKFTFDEFIVGPSNHFAHAATLAVAQAPSKAYNPLFIYGGVGLGKTHLMQAIGNHMLSKGRAQIAYLSTEQFTNEYIDALQNRRLVEFRKKYRNVDLLLIDDIHFLAGKERLQEEFFHTFNALSDAHKQIVMSSDRPASEIVGLEQRLVSRFEWGLVTELNQPDYETRLAILRNKAQQGDHQIPDAVLEFLAANIKANIRRLEGALIRVTSYASLTRQEITVDGAERLLQDTLTQERQDVVTFDGIQRAVAEHYDIRLADMTSKRRPHAIAFPRQVAMYLCRRLTDSSLPEIANAFSRTHATVLHACNRIETQAADDSQLKHSIMSISKRIGASL